MKRTCGTCRKTFDAKTSKATFCSSSCRGKAHRRGAGATVSPLPLPAVVGESLESAVRATLVDAGRDSTPMGRLCLMLAAQMDAGAESAAGMAALSRELSARLGEALAHADVVDDVVDDLRSRRERRRAV